jgi:hypothetical protein
VLFAVAEITALDEMLKLARTEATGRVGQLERPQEVGSLLEVGANSVDLVDEVLNGGDAELAKSLLDDLVLGDRDALLVDLAVSALVEELTDVLERRISVSNIGLDDLQHLSGGLGDLDEDAIVDLEKTQKLEGLALLGIDLVDTILLLGRFKTLRLLEHSPLDADSKDELRLSGDVERSVTLRGTLGLNEVALRLAILGGILLGALEEDGALLLVGLRES